MLVSLLGMVGLFAGWGWWAVYAMNASIKVKPTQTPVVHQADYTPGPNETPPADWVVATPTPPGAFDWNQ